MTPNHGRRRNLTTIACLFATLASASTAAAQVRVRGARAAQQTIDFSDRKVTFPAMDGVEIVADWYPVKVEEGQRTPVAILIHMYPATRESWKPMVPILRNELGIAVLAYDIRGTGESIKPEDRKLAESYKNRDEAFFQNAWMDATGAQTWLSSLPYIDTERMIVIGASVGCSIALDFAARAPLNAKGVACLSPGEKYMGIDSLAHMRVLKDFDVKVLLISPEAEYAAVQKLVEASGGKAKGVKYPGGREYHGTGIFDAKYGKKVKARLKRFARVVLDIKKSDAVKSDEKKKDDDKDDDDKKDDDGEQHG